MKKEIDFVREIMIKSLKSLYTMGVTNGAGTVFHSEVPEFTAHFDVVRVFFYIFFSVLRIAQNIIVVCPLFFFWPVEFEGTKGVIRIHKSKKVGQQNGQEKSTKGETTIYRTVH